jgi:hypothetical protein
MKLIAVQGPGPGAMCVHLDTCRWVTKEMRDYPGAYPRIEVTLGRALTERMHPCGHCLPTEA